MRRLAFVTTACCAILNLNIELQEVIPPSSLYHGTASQHLESILRTGLLPMSRHAVHLSEELATAVSVGLRHARTESQLVILEVNSQEMTKAGFKFFKSTNGVWLTDQVPVEFLKKFNGNIRLRK